MRTSLPAAVLTGVQPHRASLFSKLKSCLRAACTRSQDTLMEVIGKALSTVSASDALRASSTTAATAQWFNLYNRRCSLRRPDLTS
jgi:hypothetical protein